MAREPKKTTIDGIEYTCTMFSPRKSLAVFQRLVKYLGASLGEVVEGMDPKKSLLEQDLKKVNIGQAVSKLAMSLKEDELYEFMAMLHEHVVAKKYGDIPGGHLKDQVFELHYADEGGLSRMFKVATFILKTNYSRFLEGVVGQGWPAQETGEGDQ